MFINHLIRNATQVGVDSDEVKRVFEDLLDVGPKWSNWAQLIGGVGAFFAHPTCLSTFRFGDLMTCSRMFMLTE